MITVVDIAELPSTSDGDARVVNFLTNETVGASGVFGSSYELDPGSSVGPFEAPDAYQLFYVTAGEPVAVFMGDRHNLGAGQGVYCDVQESCRFENPSDAVATFFRFVVADAGE
jgi:quercetin dioxygenase-like cupin family protein